MPEGTPEEAGFGSGGAVSQAPVDVYRDDRDEEGTPKIKQSAVHKTDINAAEESQRCAIFEDIPLELEAA